MFLFRGFLYLNFLVSSAFKVNHKPTDFLIVCSKVTKEENALVEWIEFHRLQGFQKFVLYYEAAPGDRLDSLSATQLWLLQEFYQQRGLNDLIELVPLGPLLSEAITPAAHLAKVYADFHRIGQSTAFRDCLSRFSGTTEWIYMADTDEFVWVAEPAGRVTTAEHLFAIANYTYTTVIEEEYPWANEMKDVPEVATTAFKSVFEQDAAEYVVYLRNNTLDGIVAPTVLYGDSGVFWESNNVFIRDPVSGLVNLYFDPRDHSRLNSTLRRPTFQRDKHQMNVWNLTEEEFDAHRLSVHFEHLSESTFDFLLDAPPAESIDFFQQRLRRDYINGEKTPLLPPSHLLIEQDLNAIREFELLFDRLKTEKMETEKLKTQDNNLEYERVLDRLYQIYSELWSNFYPLVVEEGVWRMPAGLAGDPLNRIYNLIVKLYPDCKEYVDAIRAHDLLMPPERLLYNQADSGGREAPHLMCDVGREPPKFVDVTQVGKAIYWTGEWIRRAARNGVEMTGGSEWKRYHSPLDIPGCQFPWIHFCGTQPFAPFPGTLSRSNPLYELRIDHHSSRSFVKRTLSYAGWRKNHPLGRLKDRQGRVISWLQYANAIKDSGLRTNWRDDLREAIRQLHPLPKFSDYSLYVSDMSATVTRRGLLTKCAPGELLSEARARCPSSHPRVSYSTPGVVTPPSPLIVGGYCVRDIADDERLDLDNVFQQDVVLCPGWPETSCCDWEDSPEDAAAAAHQRYGLRDLNISNWMTPSVCVGCRVRGSSAV